MEAANAQSERARRAEFTLTVSDSAPSSRASSPAPAAKNHLYMTDSSSYLNPMLEEKPPGRKSADVYDATLPAWRAAVRRRIVENVKWESRVIARMQDAIRTPWLDAYFVYASTLGTHTFFMIVLPSFFFFGYETTGRGLLTVLAFGVYLSSFVKDLLCSPRPFAPPVTRLTIGTHHLEYGFPSTHSTNSVSIALFLWSQLYMFATPATSTSTAPVSPEVYTLCSVLLVWYTFSIVYGRIYTAMHSFSDCIMGVALGTFIWWTHGTFPGISYTLPSYLSSLLPSSGESSVRLFKGLGWGQVLEDWVRGSGWSVPLTIIPLGALAVNQHPQPVDDCPCFEDAIAFMSVALGMLLGTWGINFGGLRASKTLIMPGSGWAVSPATGAWVAVERTWQDVVVWWAHAGMKMVLGTLIIVVWRIVAKSLLHFVLPPLFRVLAKAFELPNRRFYTPATDYKSVPAEAGLHPIPSVIDLPGASGVGVEVGGIGSGSGIGRRSYENGDVKVRGRNGNARETVEFVEPDGREGKDTPVKHYDADVLTKVVVYAGIAVLATEGIPVLFELLGWGVRSWPAVV